MAEKEESGDERERVGDPCDPADEEEDDDGVEEMDKDVGDVVEDRVEGGKVEVDRQGKIGKETGGPELPDRSRIEVADRGVVPDRGTVVEVEGGPEGGEIDDRSDQEDEKETDYRSYGWPHGDRWYNFPPGGATGKRPSETYSNGKFFEGAGRSAPSRDGLAATKVAVAASET